MKSTIEALMLMKSMVPNCTVFIDEQHVDYQHNPGVIEVQYTITIIDQVVLAQEIRPTLEEAMDAVLDALV